MASEKTGELSPHVIWMATPPEQFSVAAKSAESLIEKSHRKNHGSGTTVYTSLTYSICGQCQTVADATISRGRINPGVDE
jgi:hypothetical protein